MSRRRLVTIPFSHYCEKVRWALDRAGMSYDEEMHLPFFHMIPARLAGGKRQVPVLVTPHGPIEDSTRIIEWIDATLPEEKRLFPHDPTLRAEVARWEDRFDADLGPHTRRWGYGHLLPDRERSLALLRKHAPAWEFAVLERAYPVARALMNRGLNITPAGVERSLAKLNAIFDDVSRALEDGRKYLVGDRFSAADLAFASLSAPALLPDGYAKWLGGRDEAPPSMHATIDAWRATPAGRYALRVYAEDR
jgi:glutathione S-transferase